MPGAATIALMGPSFAPIAALLWIAACGGAPSAIDASSAGAIDAGAADDARADAAPPVPPEPPAGLSRWLVGDPGDAAVVTEGAGVILMGGGTDVDEAFEWQRDRIAGGDVVVIRTSGADGYNDYLYELIGGADSVETLLLDRREMADDPYTGWVLDHAEAIFLAGGDQATYVASWTDTRVQTALQAAWARGAIVGGTSAGCAVLGQFLFSAENGTLYSGEALEDPYVEYLVLARDFAAVPVLAGVITDTHFSQRDRLGRLVAFLARIIADDWASAPRGLGIDEGTALVVDHTGAGHVLGSGAVHLVAPDQGPQLVEPGAALEWSGIAIHELRAGDTVALPAGATDVAVRYISAAGGALTQDP